MTLIELILREMESDMDNFSEKQSDLLLGHYNDADAAGKEAIDNVMICLCGWSLKTLITQLETENT